MDHAKLLVVIPGLYFRDPRALASQRSITPKLKYSEDPGGSWPGFCTGDFCVHVQLRFELWHVGFFFMENRGKSGVYYRFSLV